VEAHHRCDIGAVMFPCPECHSRNTRPRDTAHVSLWPYSQVTRHKVCQDCGTHFITAEELFRIIKKVPKLGKKHTLSKKIDKPKRIRNVLLKMEIGDYIIAADVKESRAITGSMNKLCGSGCMRVRKSKKSDRYICQRIK
jgi:transcriptional regulator NrdR family protein